VSFIHILKYRFVLQKHNFLLNLELLLKQFLHFLFSNTSSLVQEYSDEKAVKNFIRL